MNRIAFSELAVSKPLTKDLASDTGRPNLIVSSWGTSISSDTHIQTKSKKHWKTLNHSTRFLANIPRGDGRMWDLIKSCLCILWLWLSSMISALNFLNVFSYYNLSLSLYIYMPLPVILWSMSSLLMMASLCAEREVQHFPYVKKSGAYVEQTSVAPASDAWMRKWTESSTRHLQASSNCPRISQTMKSAPMVWTSCSRQEFLRHRAVKKSRWSISSAPAGTQRSSGAMCGLEGLQEFRRRDFLANETAVDFGWFHTPKFS